MGFDQKASIDLVKYPLLTEKTIKLIDLADTLRTNDFSKFLITVGWLLKLGLCRYDPPGP